MDASKRSCLTCKHHNPGKSIDDAPSLCWTCLSSRGFVELPLWEPKETAAMKIAPPPAPPAPEPKVVSRSDGSSADYYRLPQGATELQDLIGFKNMNAQVGEIFRACYRMGQASHSDCLRDAKKILFYAKAEVERLEKYAHV